MFGIDVKWNYFEVGYGKGLCDGFGGLIKCLVDEVVKLGKVIIQDVNDFFLLDIVSILFYEVGEIQICFKRILLINRERDCIMECKICKRYNESLCSCWIRIKFYFSWKCKLLLQ